MENQPQNPEFRNNPENLHPWIKTYFSVNLVIPIKKHITTGYDYKKSLQNQPQLLIGLISNLDPNYSPIVAMNVVYYKKQY